MARQEVQTKFLGKEKKGEGDNRGAEDMPMRHEGSWTSRIKERIKDPW